MSFLNPALVAGALLFAVPLLIHLLNRQRHKRRDWAAMEFLLRAYQKTRNRLRNENLLLLLLRCLIPIVLAFAVARPVLEHSATLLGQQGGTHHVFVLDQSYSMGYARDGAQSPFDKGRQLGLRLLERLQDHPERNDKVTLVTAGVRPRFLARVEQNLGLAKARWLEAQRPEDAATELLPTLLQVAQALDETPEAHTVVYVVSDQQKRSFGKALEAPNAVAASGPEFKDTLRDVVERLQKRNDTELHWIDVGPFAESKAGGTAENVQITGVRIEQPVAIARLPQTVVVQLKNRGLAAGEAQVTLEIDGGEPVRKVVRLEPAAEGEAEFQVAFHEPGRRRRRATLLPDGLEADDSWYTTVDVRERVRVLVVDGSADDDPLKTYGYFWRGMLDPASFLAGTDTEIAPELQTFQVTAVDTLALLSGQQSPLAYDVTVLADVDRVNERAAAEIEQALRAGKGLLLTPGRRVDAASYDLHLFAGGEGPLPFRLGQQLGGNRSATDARVPRIVLPTHATLREFDEPVYREILQAIPVQRWFGAQKDPMRDSAEVVLRLSDPDQSPLLVTDSFGQGRVAVMTSAPASEYDGERWNRFDDHFVVHPLLFGLVQWLALPAQDPFNVAVGAELACSLPARPVDVEVLLPERLGATKQPISEESRPLPGGRYSLPPFAGTVMAGFYTVDLDLERDSGKEPWSEPFAVDVDPDEGDLAYAAHDEVRTALALPRVITGLPTQGNDTVDAGGREFGPMLLWLLLALVVGEAAMARYVSVRRS